MGLAKFGKVPTFTAQELAEAQRYDLERLAGKRPAAIAAIYGVHRTRVEQVLMKYDAWRARQNGHDPD